MVSHPFPATHCLYILYSYFGNGEGGEMNQREVRKAIVHKAGRKYQHDCLYLQSINSIKHQLKTTFSFGVCVVY
jgi:hypothetical protein